MSSIGSSRNSKKIPGTKTSLQNSQILISSGVPSLDHVIGGGIPIGTIFLIEEDEYAKYSNVMFKYYLSEGVVCNHKIFVASAASDCKKLINDLPSPTNIDIDPNKPPSNPNEDMVIAWRYNNLNTVESGMNSSLQFGHYFDLATPMDSNMLNKADINHWEFSDDELNDNNIAYQSLLTQIKSQIKHNDNTNVLRIGIASLGSPHWQQYEHHDSHDDGKTIIEFLYMLRAVIRSTHAVALITIPTHLFKSSNVALHLRHSVDACIKLDSFAGTDRENNSALRDYHGLFYIPKILSNNLLSPYIPPTLDLAFKLKRKKFLIEKLHLPPELQETTEREQDDGSGFGCGSIKKRNLDF